MQPRVAPNVDRCLQGSGVICESKPLYTRTVFSVQTSTFPLTDSKGVKSPHTFRGTCPASVHTSRMTLCPLSAVGSNINGQPPSITVISWSRPYSVASRDTLPPPTDRCIQTRVIPRSAHSRMVLIAVSGFVPMTTASTPPGIDLRSW